MLKRIRKTGIQSGNQAVADRAQCVAVEDLVLRSGGQAKKSIDQLVRFRMKLPLTISNASNDVVPRISRLTR